MDIFESMSCYLPFSIKLSIMVNLRPREREMLDGREGAAAQFSMNLLLDVAESYSAPRFVDIAWAHVAGAYDNTRANIDFARHMANRGARVSVPTTLTSCSFDTSAPVAGNTRAIELIALYESMGCEPVMTCAPYHARPEPTPGTHLAWCESSAVVYANSVLGARTNRYVEFFDLCAAITGCVPKFGLHCDEMRRAATVIELDRIPEAWFAEAWFFQALGVLVARRVGDRVPVIDGLPATTTRSNLRNLGSAAATSGAVNIFHAVGLTPEAPDLDTACQGSTPEFYETIDSQAILRANKSLSTGATSPATAVCVGAPHYSMTEFEYLSKLLDGRTTKLPVIASTDGATLAQLEYSGLLAKFREQHISIVSGRCTYYKPFAGELGNHVLTDSAKWAWYAPTALGIDVTFASIGECIERAVRGV